tara:strand:- start:6989 stop:8314 length:1326 start_codon:yes stop_codon:yes gene_type:complete
MIPKISELLLKQSEWDWNQRAKNEWKTRRKDALNYYNGRTDVFTKAIFSDSIAERVPIGNVNITKRIIDRISMVYMVSPKRDYTRPDIPDYFVNKDFKMQRLERMTNLLDSLLIKACWREGKIEYDIIHDFEPHFGDDPLKPIGFTYPLSARSEVLDTTPELFVYWDKEHTFTYDQNGKILKDEGNPEHINPYGILPFVECWREGKPEYAYLDTEPTNDLISTNFAINVAETNKNANVHYQSFGYLYANGSQIDQKSLNVGQDQIHYLGVDGVLNVVAPPNSVPALSSAIQDSYKLLAKTYHLSDSFTEGTTAESGVALRLRNQELQDERKSDVVRWKDVEHKLFEVEKVILLHEVSTDAGELENVDFGESTDILSPQEQRDKWEWELSKGLIDEADILMQMNPDGFPERQDALDYLAERKSVPEVVEGGTPLLDALTKPV